MRRLNPRTTEVQPPRPTSAVQKTYSESSLQHVNVPRVPDQNLPNSSVDVTNYENTVTEIPEIKPRRILKIPIIIQQDNDELVVSCPLLTSEERGKDLKTLKANMQKYFEQLAKSKELDPYLGQFDYLEVDLDK